MDHLWIEVTWFSQQRHFFMEASICWLRHKPYD